MADKAITDLNVVPGTIDDGNTWFAVAQSGAAYKVSGHEFILALTSILDGHGGIKTITYTDPVAPSLTGTLTITLADDTYTSLSVQNGKGITSIAKTGTSGLVDTYTISYNDGTTSTFTVTNGAKGDTGDSWYVWIRYSGSQPTQDSDMGTDPDNWMGIYSGTSSTAPTHYTDYDWFEIKGEKGDQGDPSSIVSQSVTYQEGTTPNIQPSGTWTTTIPAVAQGNYLWTKTEIEFNSGSPVQFFSVARMGVDGAGSVSSVNGQSPDGTGNVTVTASNIQTTDSTSVQYELDETKNTLNSLGDDVDAVETTVSKILPVITGTTNNSGYTIASGDYFEANGVLYHATASIPVDTAWATSAQTASGNGGLNIVASKRIWQATAFDPAQSTIANVINNYEELYIRIYIADLNFETGLMVPCLWLRNLSSSRILVLPGYYWDSSSSMMVRLNVSSTNISINNVVINGTSRTASLALYFR